jgi:hypothetical protein
VAKLVTIVTGAAAGVGGVTEMADYLTNHRAIAVSCTAVSFAAMSDERAAMRRGARVRGAAARATRIIVVVTAAGESQRSACSNETHAKPD